jgi:hypothetical protein
MAGQLPSVLAILNMENMSQTPCFDIAGTISRCDPRNLIHTEEEGSGTCGGGLHLGIRGNIRVVVGIDMGYKDKSATLSTWQPRLQANEAGEEELVSHQTLSNQVCSHTFCLAYTYISKEFRKENVEVNPQKDLRLHLEDFAPPLLSKHTKFGIDIFIPSTDLCAYLRDAEQDEMNVKQELGYADPLKPGVKRKRRSSTPAEELNTDDESRYQEAEERADKRSREDTDYEGS